MSRHAHWGSAFLIAVMAFGAGCSEPTTKDSDAGTTQDAGGPARGDDRLDAGDALDAASQDPGDGDRGLDASAPEDAGDEPLDAGDALDAGLAPDGGALDDAGEGAPLVGLPYPERDAYLIKGVQPDFWPNKDELVGHKTGAVAMNLVWAHWEPTVKATPCGANEAEYDGRCFVVGADVEDAIADWSARGVVVTAVLYGVPAWARVGNPGCSPHAPGFEIFCTPDDASDFARFAGMLAERYDGLHGHGRIADFVIHNEVNANAWFDIGCGQGVPCDTETWIQTYVDNYVAAYDAIKAHQSEAKVLASFEHHFDTTFDQPADPNALLSVKTFVTELDARVGDREWMIAYHPYAPDLRSPVFSPSDLPRVTYGNLGVLLGWLRTAFPDEPHAWQVQLTESGINSVPPLSSEAAQAPAVCDSLRNVLGTPGVTSYIYHRLRDHPDEEGLKLGLIREDGTYKPAWSTWALANHYDDQPPQLSCGFEDLPYTRLRRGARTLFGDVRVHWASSRILPADYDEESSWRLHREPVPGTVALYECEVDSALWGAHNLLSRDPGCEGRLSLGPVGHIWTAPFQGGVALYRCRRDSPVDHFVSEDPACEGELVEELLGYAQP